MRAVSIALFLFLAACLGWTCLSAQHAGGAYALLLKAGTFQPQPNLDAFIENPQFGPEEIVDGHFVRLLQFWELPTESQRQSLTEAGLKLLDYLPNRAFLVAIPVEFDLSYLLKFPIRAVIGYQSEWKTDPALNQLPLPTWALNVPGKIDLSFQFLSNFSSETVLSGLVTQGIEILAKNPAGNVFIIRTEINRVREISSLPFLLYLEPIMPPAEHENYTGRSLHHTSAMNNETGIGRQYDGRGVVVAVGDDGSSGPHIDYAGRLDNGPAGGNTGNHGDHVTGIVMGAGNLDPLARGNAPGCDVIAFDVWDAVDNSPTTHVQDSVMITTTSYGNGCNAGYTSYASLADQTVRQNPSLIHVFSAGNSGTTDCGFGAGNNWGNITGGIKIGKNVIAVGNLNAIDGLAGSSSRGPSGDGRIKPDVCAKGTSVFSTYANNAYASISGTSMAAPGVAGTLATLYQAYKDLNGGQIPESPLIKACLMNTAEDLGNPGPDFKFGFGRINALRAVKTLEQNRYSSDIVTQGGQLTHAVTVPPGTTELRAMLYWLDWEGSPGANFALVNNLDFSVSNPIGATFLPWILDPTPNPITLDLPAVRGIDVTNNVEQITIPNPVPGTYTLTVNGTFVPMGSQRYYVVWEARDSSITMAYPIGGESFKPGETETLRWDTWGDFGSFSLEYSTNGGANWQNIATGINGGLRQRDWSVPQAVSGNCLVRITRAGVSGQSENHFNIIGVPTGLAVSSACPTSVTLGWNPVLNASGYEVNMLGNKYMDSIGTTTSTTFQINGLNQNDTYWFSVKALGANGAVGRRAIAIEKGPGTWNCMDPDDAALAEVIIPGEGTILSCVGLNNANVVVKIANNSPNTLINIPVSYRLDGGNVINETYAGSIPGFGSAEHTFISATHDFSVPGNHQIEAWVSYPPDQNPNNDDLLSYTQIVGSSLQNLPWSEDFESFSACGTNSNCGTTNCTLGNGWHNVANGNFDDIDWRTDAGGTPSNNTGPSYDHKPGNAQGKYLYTEASDCFEKVALSLTPCLDLTNEINPEFSFWFHLYGADMGDLHIDVNHGGRWDTDVIPPMGTNWFNSWWEGVVNLQPYAGEIVFIRFRGETGEDFTSDIAIDDINATQSPLLSKDEELVRSGIAIYPNPGNGIFNVAIRDFEGEPVSFQVIDAGGRIIHRREISPVQGGWTGQLDLGTVAAGIYQLQITKGAHIYFSKLAVVH